MDMMHSRRCFFQFACTPFLSGGAGAQTPTKPTLNERLTLQQMITGFRWSQMLSVAAKLRLADQLRDGPVAVRQLAQAVGAHEDSLYRVLRALASRGIFAEEEGRRFRLTPAAELLRSGVPGSLRVAAEVSGEDWYWNSFGSLRHTVTTGQTAFDHVYGKNTWDWFQDHPEPASLFNAFMNEVTAVHTLAITQAFDFSPYRVIADIGGGEGVLLAAALKQNPRARGILLDLPHVIHTAQNKLESLKSRIQFAPGDFFRSVPSGAGLYMLKNIVHDWNDDKARQILVSCRRAMPITAILLLIESVICGPNQPCEAKLGDVTMMVRTGGRNRTEHEHRALLASAGFELRRIVSTKNGPEILEALPRS
jgi:hypothetical protein